MANRDVEFYQHVEFFGPRDALLGTAKTDATGVAVLLYQPAVRGKQSIVARLAEGGGFAKSEGTATIEIRDVDEPYEAEPMPLAAVRQWLPAALGGVVVLVWALLLGVLVTTAAGIRAVARRSEARRTTATPEPAAGARRVAES